VIIGQVFLVLVGIAGALLYYLNNLNNDLQLSIEQLKERLSDEKRHAKGLRIKIQDQAKKLAELEESMAKEEKAESDLKEKYQALESEYQAIQKQIEALEKQLKKEESKGKKSLSKIESLETENTELSEKVDSLNKELANLNKKESDKDFEAMYYDLKNAVAFNMNGGDQVLDTLRERLLENGNMLESDQLSELKERYNSIGEMIGVVDDVVIFAEEEDDEETIDKDSQQIDSAEDTIKQVEQTLESIQNLEAEEVEVMETGDETAIELSKKLSEAHLLNKQLKQDLNVTTNQLMAFVQKAKLFTAQKEQIKMHKATQNQMHRNYVSLSNDHKLLQRKLKNTEAENKILAAQTDNANPEMIKKLEDLRSRLDEKESEMDRLKVENEMLEQQFLSISEESNIHAETESALDRLTSEHQLLEQQFLEVLGELEREEPSVEES